MSQEAPRGHGRSGTYGAPCRRPLGLAVGQGSEDKLRALGAVGSRWQEEEGSGAGCTLPGRATRAGGNQAQKCSQLG